MGKLQSETDPNNQITIFTYDLLGREYTKTAPDGGKITTCHSDTLNLPCSSASLPVTVTTTSTITGSMSEGSVAVEDALGRVTQTQLTSDPVGTVYVNTTYDALGRKATVSNPYRSTSESTYGITTYNYDALSRVTVLIPPDGTASADNVTTTYATNCTTVTDQAGKARKSCTDGLGRMTGVWEDPAGLNYETDYQYDALGNLLSVNQKGGNSNSAYWRTRTFSYNSLSQLLAASNPESGTIQYTYDNDGNVATKVAPLTNQTGSATVTTTYSPYDGLHRLKGKTYSNGDPAVSYTYDQANCLGLPSCFNVGRRTAMSDASGSTAWSYDQMGRTWTEQRTIGTVAKNIGYTYNLAGSLATLTYPSGRTLTYKYEAAGRPSTLRDVPNGINYVTGATIGTPCSGEDGNGACYAPHGALATMVNGYTSSFAGITTTNSYDKRLQPAILSASAPSQTVFSLSYDFHLGTGDNGNVFQIVNNRDNTRTQAFTYDTLNRIATAQTPNSNLWGASYVIDAWGNLTNMNQNPQKTYGDNLQAAPATTSNQLTGYCYDAAGNLTGWGTCPSSVYVYDGENRVKTTEGVNYTYDGDGERVKKDSGKLYWTGTASGPLTETDLSGNPTADYVFFNGKRIARVDLPAGDVRYYYSDHLGSASVITTASGAIYKDSDYFPYGVEYGFIWSDTNTYKFTGKERDTETGLDYFGARYYWSNMGRWMSPDWAARPTTVPYAEFGDPQSLNQYGYVRNNPLSHADADGHCPECAVEDATVETATEATSTGTVAGAGGSLGSLFGAAGAVVVSAYFAITRTADAYVANKNDEAKLAAEESRTHADNQARQQQQQQTGAPAPTMEDHTKGARPSTQEKHQAGQARRKKDRGGEKADEGRRPPRKRPPGWKGPWPPKKPPEKPPAPPKPEQPS